MLRRTILFLLSSLMMAAPALAAGANPVAGKDQPYGLLVTSFKNTPNQLYPVIIESLDGYALATEQRTLRVKPGTYRVRVSLREPVDRGFAPGVKFVNSNTSQLNEPPLELEVEAGKIYYIGARVGRPDQDIEVTVWKTEDSGR